MWPGGLRKQPPVVQRSVNSFADQITSALTYSDAKIALTSGNPTVKKLYLALLQYLRFSGTVAVSTTLGEAMAAELQLDTRSSKSDLIATVCDTPTVLLPRRSS